MSEKKCCCGCICLWLSGFFAMPAAAHLIRAVAKWDLMVKGEPMSINTSWLIVLICGALALIFGVIGCKKQKAEVAPPSGTCCS